MAYFMAKGIKKNFGGVKALVDGEVTLHKGKILGLLGANGSGKSTLSKIISGIHAPCGGQLILDGESIVVKNPQEAEKKLGIVMVHQHLSLIPELSVWQNIILGREKLKNGGFLSDDDNRLLAGEALHKLTDEIDLDALVKTLSPAHKQLVEIAKALSRTPKILILDEPTAALEQAQVKILFNLLNKLKDEGVAMVFISHRMWEVTKLCDYISVFRNGYTVGHVDFEAGVIDENEIVSMITGKEVSTSTGNAGRKLYSNAKSILKVKGLTLDKRVRNLDLDVKEGEIVGIAGLQGQGQEELLMVLSGFMKKDSGEVSVDGLALKMKSPKEAIRHRMVLVPGDRHEEGAFLSHSVKDNSIYPSFAVKGSGIFTNKKKNKVIANDVVSKMNVCPPNPDMLVTNLSGGNQQKVVVGKWLQLEPKVLLLSDPAKGVDVNAKEEMYNVVRELSSNGTSVVIYASDNEELIHLCDRILVMFEGNVIADLPAQGLSDEALVAASLGIRKTIDTTSNNDKQSNKEEV